MNVNTKTSMPRALIVHAGLPKTGTTAIQTYFSNNHDSLNSAGIGVLSRQGTGHHFALGQYLLSLDNRHLINGFASEVVLSDDQFPIWDEKNHAYVISDEGLVNIGSNGVRAVESYAEKNGAYCHVVIVTRDPRDWIYSLWTQATKINESHDWIDWLEKALEDKVGFISSALSSWYELDSFRVSLVEYSSTDMVKNFFAHLGMPYSVNTQEIKNPSPLNVTAPVVEVICGAAFNEMVRVSVQKFGSPLLPGEIQRILLDLTDNSRPMFEMARAVEERMALDGTLEDRILGYQSFSVLSTYLRSWAEDAESFFQLNRERFDQPSSAVIQTLISKASKGAEQLVANPHRFKKLPQKNAALKVPIDASFIAMVRVVSHLVMTRPLCR